MWWLGVAAVWTVLALMSTTQTALVLASRGEPVPWGALLTTRLADWYTCAIFIPPFLWLARRFPLERGTWLRHTPIHLAASVVAVFLKYAAFSPILRELAPRRGASYPSLLAANALTELMIFWAVIGVIHAVEFYRRYRERESVALQLSAELSRAQLDVLRAQLQPHFLFNTLNAIATLIHRDPDAADSMLTRLAELLRASVHSQAAHEWTLREELHVARAYVDIMRRRFGDRVSVAWSVPADVEDMLVPTFVLQPLLENAFEHGMMEERGAMHIGVSAEREAERERVEVRDDGLGPRDETSPSEGIGLSNTRRRLAELYGGAAALRIAPAPDGGTVVSVELPRRRTSPHVVRGAARPAHV